MQRDQLYEEKHLLYINFMAPHSLQQSIMFSAYLSRCLDVCPGVRPVPTSAHPQGETLTIGQPRCPCGQVPFLCQRGLARRRASLFPCRNGIVHMADVSIIQTLLQGGGHYITAGGLQVSSCDPYRRKGANKRCFCPSVRLSVRRVHSK